MSKYIELTKHLATLDTEAWEASFDEIEGVLGFPLPASAHQYSAWWANQHRAQSSAWEGAGWRTTSVDLQRKTVTFVYVGGREDPDTSTAPLTIAEAKAGLAANFGVSTDAIEITIRG